MHLKIIYLVLLSYVFIYIYFFLQSRRAFLIMKTLFSSLVDDLKKPSFFFIKILIIKKNSYTRAAQGRSREGGDWFSLGEFRLGLQFLLYPRLLLIKPLNVFFWGGFEKISGDFNPLLLKSYPCSYIKSIVKVRYPTRFSGQKVPRIE